jgi:hypothetical protein
MVRLRGVVGWDRGTVQDSSISKLGIRKTWSTTLGDELRSFSSCSGTNC